VASESITENYVTIPYE